MCFTIETLLEQKAPVQVVRFSKTSANVATVERSYSLWSVGANPPAGSVPAHPGAVPTNQTTGALPIRNAGPGLANYLIAATVQSTTPGTLIVADRLMHFSVTEPASAIGSPSVLATRGVHHEPSYAGLPGGLVAVEALTGSSGNSHALSSLSWIAPNGVTTGTDTALAFRADKGSFHRNSSTFGIITPAITLLAKGFPNAPAINDAGIAGESVAFVVYSEIAQIPILTPNRSTRWALPHLTAEVIEPGACLFLIFVPSLAEQFTVSGSLEIVEA